MQATTAPTRRSRGLFYGWYIALAGALSNFLSAGIAVWGFGIFIDPLKDEMGWSTAAIALGFSIRSFEQGLLAPLTGVLVDRLGPRKMAISGTAILVVGILIFSQARSLWMYYTASIVMAVGQSVGSFLPYSAVLMRWFERKRGRAMGILNAGNGSGYFVVPALAFLIGAVGWRETLVIGAVAVAVVSLPLAATVVRDHPAEKNEFPDGIPVPRPAAGTAAAVLPGLTVSEALHTPTFYLLALASAGNGATILGWIVHQIPHLKDVGFSLGWATGIGVIYAVCQITIRPAAGILGDRIGRKRLFAASFVLQSLGMVVFAFLSDDRLWLLPLYYVTFAFGQAAWVVLQQAVVADYFGPRRFGTIAGLVNAVQMPVGVGSPVIAGLVFDSTGTYVPVFIAYACTSMLAAVSIMLIRRPTLAAAEASATFAAAH
ncbi:MAG: MFS transporter [Dehalococcoidia bacterium]